MKGPLAALASCVPIIAVLAAVNALVPSRPSAEGGAARRLWSPAGAPVGESEPSAVMAVEV